MLGVELGIILTSRNDLDEMKECYRSLKNSMTGPYSLVGVDGGSTDGSDTWLAQTCQVFKPYSNLSVALNVGIEALFRGGAQHICWIHPDMRFPEEGWTEKLLQYLFAHPDVGKVSPHLQGTPEVEAAGNQCPWIMPSIVLQKLLEKDGFMFDEKFLKIGGYEDWDLNKRVMDLGYKVMITKTPTVIHQGAGTRFSEKRNQAEKEESGKISRRNAVYYYSKWKTYDPFV